MANTPIEELIDILTPFSTGTAMFLLVALVPWGCVALVRIIYGTSHLFYKSVFWAAAVATVLATTKLLMPGAAAGLSPTGLWYFMFLYAFIPVWIIISLIFGTAMLIFSRFSNKPRQ